MLSGNTRFCGMVLLCHIRGVLLLKKFEKQAPYKVAYTYLLQEFSTSEDWSVLWVSKKYCMLHIPDLFGHGFCVSQNISGYARVPALIKVWVLFYSGFNGTRPKCHELRRAWPLSGQPQTQGNPKVTYQMSHSYRDSPHFWSLAVSLEQRGY